MTNPIVTAAALAAFLGMTAGQVTAAETTHGLPAAGKRTITIAAVEPKGGTNVKDEAFPQSTLPKGGGYLLKAPDASGRWEVSTYVWVPSQIIVNQGDEVTLEYVGINGAEHPAVIEGYEKTFVVRRGQVTKVTFKADKAGVFRIVCGIHHPSMQGELIVLARN